MINFARCNERAIGVKYRSRGSNNAMKSFY